MIETRVRIIIKKFHSQYTIKIFVFTLNCRALISGKKINLVLRREKKTLVLHGRMIDVDRNEKKSHKFLEM